MRQLLPQPEHDVDPFAFYAYPPERPWLRANMVASVDGSAVVDGRAGGLATEVDKSVFATLRALSDVVLVGAGTARAEGYRALRAKPAHAEQRAAAGQPPAPVLAVVTRRLALEPTSDLFHGGAQRTVVITRTPPDAEAREHLAAVAEVADVIVAGEDAVDLAQALDELAGRGLTRMLCEGGPRLLADITAAGRLNELCLTVTPALVGGFGLRILSGPPLGGDGPVPLSLARLLEEDGSLLARYVVG